MPVSSKNMIFGRHPIEESLESGSSIEKIFIQKGLQSELLGKIRELATQQNIPLSYVPVEKLNRLTRSRHQGIIAILSAVNYYRLEDIIPSIYENGEIPLIVVLDGISDVRNMGAIARTAWCSGVHALVVGGHNTAPMSPDSVKASAGALNHLPVCRHQHMGEVLDILFANGIKVIAAHGEGTESPADVDFTGPGAIVLGDEAEGISEQVIRKADNLIRIPMKRDFDSLNVSVAAGMLLYEAMKQRG